MRRVHPQSQVPDGSSVTELTKGLCPGPTRPQPGPLRLWDQASEVGRLNASLGLELEPSGSRLALRYFQGGTGRPPKTGPVLMRVGSVE